MKPKFLCVGLVCVDIIQFCKSYPSEDSDQRCLDCYLQRGGNAANNCTVLSELGIECEFFGNLSDDLFSNFLKEDFKKNNINIENCVIQHGFEIPLSTVIINSQNGSRTIVHSNKNWPEITFEEFKKLDLTKYNWINFEGRNLSEVTKMMNFLRENKPIMQDSFRISVELEKPRSELLTLSRMVDVVFVGKDFAIHNGWLSMEDAVARMDAYILDNTSVICTWGEKGAIGRLNGRNIKVECCGVNRGVETLGAGDTFLAAAILALASGATLQAAISAASRTAAAKVAKRGFKNLKSTFEEALANVLLISSED